jgi:hypothetical protein
MKIHSLITLIITVTPLTFTSCDDKLGAFTSQPPIQNINREVIIVMPPLEVKTVPENRNSIPSSKEVSPCL